MNRHRYNPKTGFPLYSESVADFAALATLPLPSSDTVLLLVADFRGVSTDTISHAANHLFASGLSYLCVWGSDCERVHDTFDLVYVGDGSREPDRSFISTWHANEPLDEALWCFLQCAIPPDSDIATTTRLAVTIGSPELAASVEHALSNVPAFVSRMLADETK
jgi:hypothetical protein